MATSLTSTGITYPDSSEQTTAANVQSGIIIMWGGESVPEGWVLCDGNNGTPNLTDKFVICAGSTYSVDDTGGSANTAIFAHTHTSSIAEDGNHNHDVTPNTHSHSFSVNANGLHTHAITVSLGAAPDASHTHSAIPLTSPPQGSHSHITTSTISTHTHPFTINPTSHIHGHGFAFDSLFSPSGLIATTNDPTVSQDRATMLTAHYPDFLGGPAPGVPPGPAAFRTAGKDYDITHNHTVTINPSGDNPHSHPGTFATFPDHTHSFSSTLGENTGHIHSAVIPESAPVSDHFHDSVTIDPSVVQSSSNNNHTHTITVSPAGNSLNTNLPPYYALAFIMKT